METVVKWTRRSTYCMTTSVVTVKGLEFIVCSQYPCIYSHLLSTLQHAHYHTHRTVTGKIANKKIYRRRDRQQLERWTGETGWDGDGDCRQSVYPINNQHMAVANRLASRHPTSASDLLRDDGQAMNGERRRLCGHHHTPPTLSLSTPAACWEKSMTANARLLLPYIPPSLFFSRREKKVCNIFLSRLVSRR